VRMERSQLRQWIHGHFCLSRSCSLTSLIAKQLFNGVNVPRTKFTAQSVLETNSRIGVCSSQNNILRVSCRQKNPYFYVHFLCVNDWCIAVFDSCVSKNYGSFWHYPPLIDSNAESTSTDTLSAPTQTNHHSRSLFGPSLWIAATRVGAARRAAHLV